jgi:hypothetical protein
MYLVKQQYDQRQAAHHLLLCYSQVLHHHHNSQSSHSAKLQHPGRQHILAGEPRPSPIIVESVRNIVFKRYSSPSGQVAIKAWVDETGPRQLG